MHPGLAPQCGPTHYAAHHGSTWVYSGNAAAVVGVVICVVLLLWWAHERARIEDED